MTVTLPHGDVSFLKKLSEHMGWKLFNNSSSQRCASKCNDETEYLSSSDQMAEIIERGMKDAQSGNYRIVNVDEL